jgi:hypothetical protein
MNDTAKMAALNAHRNCTKRSDELLPRVNRTQERPRWILTTYHCTTNTSRAYVRALFFKMGKSIENKETTQCMDGNKYVQPKLKLHRIHRWPTIDLKKSMQCKHCHIILLVYSELGNLRGSDFGGVKHSLEQCVQIKQLLVIESQQGTCVVSSACKNVKGQQCCGPVEYRWHSLTPMIPSYRTSAF